MEVRRRWNVDLGLQLLPIVVWRGVFLREHSCRWVYVCAHARGARTDAVARVGSQRAAILRTEFRESGVASEQQRLCRVRAGHSAADATLHLEPGRALRRADVFEDGDGE